MDYTLLFAGAGASLLGALVGAWIGARLTFGFQQKLLRQQLDFQKAQADADTLQRAAIAKEMTAAVTYLRDTLNYRLGQLDPHPPGAETRPPRQ